MEHNRSDQQKSVYDVMTEQIIRLLEEGTIPWKQNWTSKELPQNLTTKIPYRGINLVLLASLGFERNYFLTRRQLQELGGELIEGARPTPVVFWKFPETTEEEKGEVPTKDRKKPYLRYYAVYNVSQCEGIPEKLMPVRETRDNQPIKACAGIVKEMQNPPKILHGDGEAYYSPRTDVIAMPDMKWFDDSASYYATLFHELIHSTGHPSRLDRKEGMKGLPFGSEAYSQEELVAEMGACFLEAHAGIAAMKIRQNAAYIRGWLSQLKGNSKFLIYASSQAQKAADYILGDRKEVVEQEMAVPESTATREASQKQRRRRKGDHPTFERH